MNILQKIMEVHLNVFVLYETVSFEKKIIDLKFIRK